MFVKIDTKEHFRIFSLTQSSIHANMADELRGALLDGLHVPPRDIILNFSGVTQIEAPVIRTLEEINNAAAAGKASFVITEIHPSLTGAFGSLPARGRLNLARTLTEAIDLVMMERLERELSEQQEPSEGDEI